MTHAIAIDGPRDVCIAWRGARGEAAPFRAASPRASTARTLGPPRETPVSQPQRPPPHPVVWTILYIPFGALSGFVTVALTFLATQHGLSITEGALLNGAQMLTQWLKWLWAPLVDITLTPKRWYVVSTALSAVGVASMAAMPMSPSTLPALLAVIAVASLVNSVVGMSIESIMARVTPRSEIGRVSGWFQAGNLGGAGLGGGFGLFLMRHLPPWMAGVGMGALFMACCLMLAFVPSAPAHEGKALAAVKGVVVDLWTMVKTRAGLLAALLCFLPIGTGAAQTVLTQAAVASQWGGADADVVGWVQGYTAGAVTAIGCFVGGWICQRVRPRTAYAIMGVALAVIAAGMTASPRTIAMYVTWNLAYAFGVGLCYAGFTALVLDAMGPGSAATKYNTFASLSNFPIWWLGLLLGWVADKYGAGAMLLTEAAFGVVSVVIFLGAVRAVRGSKLAEEVAQPAVAT
jgi:MFS family permease